jgi:hypothetical protein
MGSENYRWLGALFFSRQYKKTIQMKKIIRNLKKMICLNHCELSRAKIWFSLG